MSSPHSAPDESPDSIAPLFVSRIASAYPDERDIARRHWIYIPYDRFTDRTGPLASFAPSEAGIVIVESTAKAHRRPYHKKKLALLIANMRHFALEQASRGVSVLYHFSPFTHGQALLRLQRLLRLPTLTLMQPAERELRLDLDHAVSLGLRLHYIPDTTWLSSPDDFLAVFGPYRPGRSYVMDRFYRRMRQHTGILMQNAQPLGGKYSHDAENRLPYKDQVPVPASPSFPPDSITLEVIAYVARQYPHHFGLLSPDGSDFDLPSTQTHADSLWSFALEHLLPHFGPFEDAMRDDHLHLFHSRTSPLVNLARLLPAQLIHDVEAAHLSGRIPLASAEGFIRQLLGWREFMHHLHLQTDGYRLLDIPTESTPDLFDKNPSLAHENTTPRSLVPGESASIGPTTSSLPPGWDSGATPSFLGANLPLPAAYWGVPSGLHCLDTVVSQVLREGWSHHITRLMVLSNLATLCGFSPRQLTDWFWFAYIDAYDWVVETNVLGMATYADGGLTATKPYVSGAAYINRMSNFCPSCQYDPKKSTGPDSCPFTALYWTFLDRNRPLLANNFRLQMPYRTLDRKSPSELVQLRTRADQAIAHLQAFPVPTY